MVACCRAGGTECSSTFMGSFEGALHFLHYLHHSLTPGKSQDFPGGSEIKASACNAGDLGSIPGSGRSPAEGNGNPLQYSCLENPIDRGAWKPTVHGVIRARHNLVTKLPHSAQSLSHVQLFEERHFF